MSKRHFKKKHYKTSTATLQSKDFRVVYIYVLPILLINPCISLQTYHVSGPCCFCAAIDCISSCLSALYIAVRLIHVDCNWQRWVRNTEVYSTVSSEEEVRFFSSLWKCKKKTQHHTATVASTGSWPESSINCARTCDDQACWFLINANRCEQMQRERHIHSKSMAKAALLSQLRSSRRTSSSLELHSCPNESFPRG